MGMCNRQQDAPGATAGLPSSAHRATAPRRFPLTRRVNGPDNIGMPRITEFYGIAIYMYYRDHAPPHFHAIYGEFEAEIEIATAEILVGDLPRRATSLVTDWAELHRDELQENWNLARRAQPMNPIPPLE